MSTGRDPGSGAPVDIDALFVHSCRTMSGKTVIDRRSERRQRTIDEILDAAWDLVREQGLSGLAMRDLGARVGMKAQSLYAYFGSKHEIYDAMFAQGYRAFVTATDVGPLTPGDPRTVEQLREAAHRFFHFCTSDPVRYQLLFQRTIPGFEPRPESYAIALESYARMVDAFAALGVDDPAAIDLWTAVMTGLTDQQISNDPGGTRWERLVDRAVDMVLREVAPATRTPVTRTTVTRTTGAR